MQGMFSVLQVKDCLRKGEVRFLATLIKIKPNQRMEVLDPVLDILEEYTFILPPELPKTLPHRHMADHKIE